MRPTISPVIWCREPRAALAWLEKAFGFETTVVVDDGQGGVVHSETCLDLEDHPWSFGQTVAAPTLDEVAKATSHDISTSL